MELEKCTWPEVDAHLKKSKRILIPIGSTEQHGPTGMIGTDSLSAGAIAKELGQRLDIMVAPTVSIGAAARHMAFAGTISLSEETLVQVIKDIVTSLSTHGFEDFIFINGHGGNIKSLRKAFEELEQSCRFYNWFSGPKTTQLRKEIYGDQEGRHATPSEIALIQYLDRETVRPAQDIDPVCAPAHDVSDAKEMRAKHPDGRMGSNVSLVKIEDGQKLFETSLEDLMNILKA